MNLDEQIEKIVNVLDSKKGEDIEVIDLDSVDYISKKVVVVSSTSPKHTQALYDYLKEELKPIGFDFFGSDKSDDWIVADLGEIIVHIMTPSYRQKYSIEEFLIELLKNKEKESID